MALPKELALLLEESDCLKGLRVRGTPPASVLASLLALSPASFRPLEVRAGIPEWDLLRGGLLYAANALDAAHAIFQEDASAEGSYWHGMMHRREGDFSNVEYWMRRAGRPRALDVLPGFDPLRFIRECARADASGREPQDLLDWQRREWEALLLQAWGRVTGSA